MKTHTIVVLPDGETWNTIHGCSIVVIDDAQFRDLIDDRIDASDLKPITEIGLFSAVINDQDVPPSDCDPVTGQEYGTGA